MSFPYVLSSMGGVVLPRVYEAYKDEGNALGYSFGLGALICLFSFITAIMLYILDNKATKHDLQLEKNYNLISSSETSVIKPQNQIPPSPRHSFRPTDVNNDQPQSQMIHCSDLKEFELGFWLMCFDCCISFMLSFTLVSLGNKMLQDRFNFTEDQASTYITLPYFICAIIMPIIGFLGDKIGKRQSIIIVAGVI